MVSGIVFDIRKFSIHDGPGIRTTVFLKGCPLACQWCHNPESQSPGREWVFRSNRCLGCGACVAACKAGAITWQGDQPATDLQRCTLCGACASDCYAEAREIVGREMTVAQVMDQIGRDVAFYDESGGGATFSGGEPLMQPDFLEALLRACRRQEIDTCLDTCGYVPWETLDRVRPLVDLFLYDLKVMDDTRHRAFTGVTNVGIVRNLERLSAEGHNIIVRVPVIPGVNDDEGSMRAIGELAARLPSVQRVDLLPYHPIAVVKYERFGREYAFTGVQPPPAETMARLVQILEGLGLSVGIGG